MHGYGDRDYGEAAHGADLGPLPDAEDGPVFDFVDTRNVTSVVRGVAVLRCSVHHLGERTVRLVQLRDERWSHLTLDPDWD